MQSSRRLHFRGIFRMLPSEQTWLFHDADAACVRPASPRLVRPRSQGACNRNRRPPALTVQPVGPTEARDSPNRTARRSSGSTSKSRGVRDTTVTTEDRGLANRARPKQSRHQGDTGFLFLFVPVGGDGCHPTPWAHDNILCQAITLQTLNLQALCVHCMSIMKKVNK